MYQSLFYALIVPSTYTTTSVTLSLSHHGKLPRLPRPFEQETQKDVSLRLHGLPSSLESGVAQDNVHMYMHTPIINKSAGDTYGG